jgi:signal transduction histidine kinase
VVPHLKAKTLFQAEGFPAHQVITTSLAPKIVLEAMLSRMNVLAQTKNLEIITQIEPDLPPTLYGDATRLQQILVNWVSNALKFTERGQVKGCIYCPDDLHWAMQVSDTGLGIPAEGQAYIFEPFRQVDGSMTREHGGSGLGLSIVKQLTELMGGHITLSSTIGQGSTFTVILPLTAPSV